MVGMFAMWSITVKQHLLIAKDRPQEITLVVATKSIFSLVLPSVVLLVTGCMRFINMTISEMGLSYQR